MTKIMPGVIAKHLKDNTVIGHKQHGSVRGMSCLSHQISFHDKVTHLVEVVEKPIDVTFLDFSKVLDTLSHSILLDKTSSTQLDKYFMR